MNVLLVSPHRDDAAFSLGLAVEGWLAAGHTVQVLNCFTQSDYAPFSDAESLHPNDRVSFVSAVRRREDAAWNKLLGGRVRFHDLDLLDAPLRLHCTPDEVAALEIRPGDRAVARVAGAVAKLTRQATPDNMAVLAPMAVGAHIDHRVTLQAVVEAFAGRELPLAFYEDLPYAGRPGEAERLAAYAETTGLALTPCYASEPGDSAAAIARKERMTECYDSQVDSEVARSIAMFSARYEGRERIWGTPAWLGSALQYGAEHAE